MSSFKTVESLPFRFELHLVLALAERVSRGGGTLKSELCEFHAQKPTVYLGGHATFHRRAGIYATSGLFRFQDHETEVNGVVLEGIILNLSRMM